MTTIWLAEGREKLCPDPLVPALKRRPLYHQQRTLESLRDHDLVANTYDTGTGKTMASLLYLFDLDRSGKNVLFIAPTNALLAQHAADVESFVAGHGLDFKVLRVSAAEVRALRLAQNPELTPTRPGELLQRLIRNYLEFEADSTRRRPVVLVVNPDIFYYALYFRYGAHDQRNIFERFLTAFDYIVVDEFHYYDSKQLANFLFAFALFDEFGYFEAGRRKVCLLSATPTGQVITYLDRLFGDRWVQVSPNNEPDESRAYETVRTLAPLELSVGAEPLERWVEANRYELAAWVSGDDLDGALISSSLWRANAAFAALRGVLPESRIGRITGPEPAQARAVATARNLILATPTVDIGYNFTKLNKRRQNVDFVVCDARHGDELIQRIGRAGRLLGKVEIEQPSRAVAMVPPEAAQALAHYDGQRLTRAEFAELVRQCPELPPKHTLTAYIRTHAIMECVWPIYQIRKVLPPGDQTGLDTLFERLREAFAPNSRRTASGLSGFYRKYERRRRWLAATKEAPVPLNAGTAVHLADWLAWLKPSLGRLDPSGLMPHLTELLADAEQQRGLRAFVASQVAVTDALFAFRDSFQGPSAVVYDPQHHFSSLAVNAGDLFHLLCYHRLSPLLTRTQFERQYGPTELTGDYYLRVLEPRKEPLTLGLVYDSDQDPDEFERRWCGAVVAPAGVRLEVRERGGGPVAGGLERSVVEALAAKPLTMLIVPPDSIGAMVSRLRGTDLWARRLTVRFPGGRVDYAYRAFLGTAAFHAHAELLGHFLLRERLKPDAIII